MSERQIVIYPQKQLRVISTEIQEVNSKVQLLIDDMLDTMYNAPGIGLAAIQIGIAKRLLVIDITEEDDNQRNPVIMINPHITLFSDEKCEMREGCLSLPDIYDVITRPDAVQVSYLDRDGNSQKMEAEGLLARVIQHEVDHLDGKLFFDHLSRIKKDMFLRKYKKLRSALPAQSE